MMETKEKDNIEVHCLWGMGPDVTVIFNSHPFISGEKVNHDRTVSGYCNKGWFDLTVNEAVLLINKLQNAVDQADKREREYQVYCENTGDIGC